MSERSERTGGTARRAAPAERSEGVGCRFCDRCGAPVDAGDHTRCAARRTLEPPRFCADCGRRMVVQVTPTSWTARCGRHGERRG